MTRPTRILWLVKGLGRGGAERLVVDLATTVGPSLPPGVEVEVAYVLPHKDHLVPELRAAGVVVHCLAGERGWSWVPRLRGLLAANGYDLVHTHSPLPAAVTRLLVPRGTVVVHTEHNVWQRYARPTRWVNAATLRRNALVLAVSQSVRDSMGRHGRHPRTTTLLHGIDATASRHGSAARAEARRRLGLGHDDRPTLLTVGTLTPKKDHAGLLAALALVRESVPDVRLVLIGAGPLQAALEGQRRDLGLEDVVVLAGLRDDVRVVLPAADLFVLPSRHEGLPIALLEAMGAGLPVLCTAVGGVPEAVTSECGRLVPPGRPDLLAAQVIELLADPQLRRRLGRGARVRSADFDIRRAAESLAGDYRRLVPPRSREVAV